METEDDLVGHVKRINCTQRARQQINKSGNFQ